MKFDNAITVAPWGLVSGSRETLLESGGEKRPLRRAARAGILEVVVRREQPILAVGPQRRGLQILVQLPRHLTAQHANPGVPTDVSEIHGDQRCQARRGADRLDNLATGHHLTEPLAAQGRVGCHQAGMATKRIGAFVSLGIENRGGHHALATDIGDHRVLAAERHADTVAVQSVPHRLHRLEALDLKQVARHRRRQPARQRRGERRRVLVCERHRRQHFQRVVVDDQGDDGGLPREQRSHDQRRREHDRRQGGQGEGGPSRDAA